MGSSTFKKQKLWILPVNKKNIDVNYALKFSEKKIANMQKVRK